MLIRTKILISLSFSAVSFMLLIGCSENKQFDFGEFTIQVPKSWQQIKQQGVDSYVGLIAIDKGDTLSFDLGRYSNDLKEDGDIFEKHANQILQRDGSIKIPERLRKNKESYLMIDQKKAKIVQPKITGNGLTGVYFDSLWKKGADIDRFQLSGHNLKPENEKALLKAIKTLKFKRITGD